MGTRKVVTTVYITVEQDEKLRLLSQATGVSKAEYIREGLDLVLDRYKHRLPHQLSLLPDD